VIPESSSAANFDGQTPALITLAFLMVTPLFHTSLPLLLMQVNFLPETVVVVPTFLHFTPVLTSAWAGANPNKKIVRTKTVNFRIKQ
jgi:hypothetical protein